MELAIKTFLSLLEPLIVIFMGVLVGCFMVVMLLPMAQLFRSLGP